VVEVWSSGSCTFEVCYFTSFVSLVTPRHEVRRPGGGGVVVLNLFGQRLAVSLCSGAQWVCSEVTIHRRAFENNYAVKRREL
jgi:hypothetical protein